MHKEHNFLPLSCRVLCGLFFGLEAEGNTFLRNAGGIMSDYTASNPKQ
jgi:hypothetical protein